MTSGNDFSLCPRLLFVKWENKTIEVLRRIKMRECWNTEHVLKKWQLLPLLLQGRRCREGQGLTQGHSADEKRTIS